MKKQEKIKKKEDGEESLEDVIKDSQEKSKKEVNKKTEIIEEIAFEEFITAPIQSRAPVLNQVAESSEAPIRLEQDMSSSPISRDEEDSFNYTTNPDEEQEEKYTNTSTTARGPERLDPNQVGKTRINQPQEAQFIQSNELKGIESDTNIKYIDTKKIDIENAGKENSFKTNLKEVERKKSEYLIK